MYLLDPDRGRPRRNRIKDQAVHTVRQADRFAGRSLRDVRNRLRGVAAETRSRLRHDDAEEPVLYARVRAAIGRVVSNPHSIEVTVDDGTVLLAGPVLANELDDLIRTVERVHGVHDVIDELDVHEKPDGVPGLQSGWNTARFPLLQKNWSPAARLISGLGGAVIALYGRRLPFPLRSPTRLFGVGLLARAITNQEARRIVGLGSARADIRIQKTIKVSAPVDQVFALWSQFENFPKFMPHLREVQRTGDLTSHWVAEGPAGTSVEWDATITAFDENRRIAWQSDPGSNLENRGIVTFEPTTDGGTRIHLRMDYNPPAGQLGHGFAALFGKNARHALHQDLARFKSLVDDGRTTADGETVTREEFAPVAVARQGEEPAPSAAHTSRPARKRKSASPDEPGATESSE
jgi:uncharacterized membrane protein